jgi:hypothetical protein
VPFGAGSALSVVVIRHGVRYSPSRAAALQEISSASAYAPVSTEIADTDEGRNCRHWNPTPHNAQNPVGTCGWFGVQRFEDVNRPA